MRFLESSQEGRFTAVAQSSQSTQGNAVSSFLGLNRNTVLLLAAIVLIAAGEETWMRFVPKYLDALGAPILAIGLYDGLKTIIGAVYALPGGIAVDRWGHRTALAASTALSIVGYAVVFGVQHWAAVLGASFLFLAWASLSLPASFTLVGESLPPQKHAMGIGIQSLVRRLPVIIGPVAGGMLMDRFGLTSGVRYGVLLSILLAGAALALQRNLGVTPKMAAAPVLDFHALRRDAGPELRRLLVSDILVRFCERIPFAWVVIYAMDNLGMSATQTGLLIAIEMAAAIVCYVPASYLADRYGKEPFVVATFVFFTLFPALLGFSQGFWSLALAFAVRGLKEFGEPARKALILAYSPEGRKGQTIGAYYLVRDGVVSFAALLGAGLWKMGPGVNFWGASAIGALGTAFYAAAVRRAKHAAR
ncbi:MAG: MFS transporter [Bryobacteraceae bacterium]|nr:MFS transporter [Bryobacteraceae bacterium]